VLSPYAANAYEEPMAPRYRHRRGYY
jgi:hypothetical protein